MFASDGNSTSNILGKKRNSLAEDSKPQDTLTPSVFVSASLRPEFSTSWSSHYQPPLASPHRELIPLPSPLSKILPRSTLAVNNRKPNYQQLNRGLFFSWNKMSGGRWFCSPMVPWFWVSFSHSLGLPLMVAKWVQQLNASLFPLTMSFF